MTESILDFEALSERLKRALRPNAVTIIGIAGHPGAGKTTLSRRIVSAFPSVAVHVECDRFSSLSFSRRQSHISAAKRTGDPAAIQAAENPRHWYDWDAIERALRGLRSRRGFVFETCWNRNTGELDESYSVALASEGPALVLCDGAYLLHSPVRELMDSTLLVEAPEEVLAERGRRRSRGDLRRAQEMERLSAVYNRPYFDAFGKLADWRGTF